MIASALWTHETIVTAINSADVRPFSATGVSIDSRTVMPGDLFVALKGPRFDGHDFVEEAFKKGAVAAIVEENYKNSTNKGVLLQIEDTMKALRDLATAARARSRAKIIAVTGSVGKTSTKEMIKLALAQSGETYANVGNLNNDIGLPLSLARLPTDAVYAIFELGMNHPGELAPLSDLLRPHLAVITTVEAVHIEFFTSEEAIADEKAEVMSGLEVGGAVVLNRDNRHFMRLLGAAKGFGVSHVIDFGSHSEAAVRLLDYSLHGNSSAVSASIEGKYVEYGLAAPGRHWISNSLAALAAVHGIGGNIDKAAVALAKLEAPKGRGQHRQIALPAYGTGAFLTLIDEAYNASPASVCAALSVLERTLWVVGVSPY
ncbi:MAG: UDP-N-acetylmuramoyl-tripeptide--D-alanyl-D-alanine ligase [Alphaproteobacteria bacterium]